MYHMLRIYPTKKKKKCIREEGKQPLKTFLFLYILFCLYRLFHSFPSQAYERLFWNILVFSSSDM